jgi:hypothetical protein
VQLRRDATYARIMKPERDRLTDRELAEWLRRHRGATDAERDAQRRALAERNRDLPFAIMLGGAVIAAIAAGALKSRAPSAGDGQIANRLLAIVGAVALGSLATVIAIDVAFH